MNHKLTTLIIIALSMLTFVLAQNDPPPLPGAPNQGPIGGMVWLAISGVVLAGKKYFDRNK